MSIGKARFKVKKRAISRKKSRKRFKVQTANPTTPVEDQETGFDAEGQELETDADGEIPVFSDDELPEEIQQEIEIKIIYN